MSRPALSDFNPRVQGQIAAQLRAAPRPRTVAIEPAEESRMEAPKRRKVDVCAMSFFERCGLPAPMAEYRFHPERRWRFDYAWPAQRVALEVEGGVWTGGRHTRGAGFLGDMEKYNAAALLGWRVLRVTPSKLCSAKTIEMIHEAVK